MKCPRDRIKTKVTNFGIFSDYSENFSVPVSVGQVT